MILFEGQFLVFFFSFVPNQIAFGGPFLYNLTSFRFWFVSFWVVNTSYVFI